MQSGGDENVPLAMSVSVTNHDDDERVIQREVCIRRSEIDRTIAYCIGIL